MESEEKIKTKIKEDLVYFSVCPIKLNNPRKETQSEKKKKKNKKKNKKSQDPSLLLDGKKIEKKSQKDPTLFG